MQRRIPLAHFVSKVTYVSILGFSASAPGLVSPTRWRRSVNRRRHPSSKSKEDENANEGFAYCFAGAGILNLSPVEYFPLFETALDDVCTGRAEVSAGEVAIPESPGHGIVFDDAAMQRYRV